jgi:hypothetical protein
MIAQPVDPERVTKHWPAALKELRRSFGEPVKPDYVLAELVANRATLWRVPGKGWILTRFVTDGEFRRLFWIDQVAGNPAGGFLALSRAIVSEFEQMASAGVCEGYTAHKCSGIGLWGRKGWGRVLSGYRSMQLPDGRWEFWKEL